MPQSPGPVPGCLQVRPERLRSALRTAFRATETANAPTPHPASCRDPVLQCSWPISPRTVHGTVYIAGFAANRLDSKASREERACRKSVRGSLHEGIHSPTKAFGAVTGHLPQFVSMDGRNTTQHWPTFRSLSDYAHELDRVQSRQRGDPQRASSAASFARSGFAGTLPLDFLQREMSRIFRILALRYGKPKRTQVHSIKQPFTLTEENRYGREVQ